MARYPQFYSRIGFVHARVPSTWHRRHALALCTAMGSPGVKLPDAPWSEGVTAAVIRITGGNFRLLNRLLTQIERILEINELAVISQEVVKAARESLVIGRSQA